MTFDFWNNPIVVSTMRVRFRRSSPAVFGSMYFLALLGLGFLLFYASPSSAYPASNSLDRWVHVYLVTVLSIQSFLSAAIAVSSTRRSINEEVLNQTLDFQRIVSLSPRQILVGKLIGEPAIAYVLVMTSVPVAVWCVILGGGPPVSLPFVYCMQFTTILMFGSLGMLHSLQPPSRRTGNDSGCGLVILAFIILPNLVAGGIANVSNPLVSALVGLFTPILAIVDVANNDPWAHRLPVFAANVPYLLVTPLSQILIAFVCIQAMARRMASNSCLGLSRPTAFGLLAATDLVTAGILFEDVSDAYVDQAIATFALAHLIASILLILLITPTRDALISWLWRFRGKRPLVIDQLFGDRSPNSVAVAFLLVIGILGLAAFLLIPALATDRIRRLPDPATVMIPATVLVAVITVCFGAIQQMVACLTARGATMAGVGTVAVLVVVNLGALFAGILAESKLIVSLCVPLHFVDWMTPNVHRRTDFDPTTDLSLWPSVVAYAFLAAACFAWRRRWLASTAEEVNSKLERMGVRRVSAPIDAPLHSPANSLT